MRIANSALYAIRMTFAAIAGSPLMVSATVPRSVSGFCASSMTLMATGGGDGRLVHAFNRFARSSGI